MNKTIIITGSNAGIGFALANHIAAIGDWHIVLACRNAEKAEAAKARIADSHPESSLEFIKLDLFSLASIDEFAASLKAGTRPPLQSLVLNAGGINMKAKELEFTQDGYERTFQLNFLGHFALTALLLDRLSYPARIVFVSSDLHDPAATKMGKMAPPIYGQVEDAAFGRVPFVKMNPMARYGTAKMFAIMCAYELDRRIKISGLDGNIAVNSWSPGVVPTTEAGRDIPVLQKKIMMSPWFVKFMGSHLSTEKEAAQSLANLAIDPQFARISGQYFDGDHEILSSTESRDRTKARSVWEQTIRLVCSAKTPLSFSNAMFRI